MVGARFLSDLPDDFREEPAEPPLPAISEVGITTAPHTLDFQRSRVNFAVNLAEVFEAVTNGIRLPEALNPGTAREYRYQQFIRRAGAATRPEFMVFEALERIGFHGDVSEEPGSDFQFQVPVLGGRSEGGSVIDFVVWAIVPPVAIRVQGEYFHFGDDDVESGDIVKRIAIEGLGMTVVDVLAQDTATEEKTNQVVRNALLGFEFDSTGRRVTF